MTTKNHQVSKENGGNTSEGTSVPSTVRMPSSDFDDLF